MVLWLIEVYGYMSQESDFMQGKQVRTAQVPEGVFESTRVLWQVLSVPHPGSICSTAAFLLARARLVADSTQCYPFIGDLEWIDGISTPVIPGTFY